MSVSVFTCFIFLFLFSLKVFFNADNLKSDFSFTFFVQFYIKEAGHVFAVVALLRLSSPGFQ